MLSAIKKIDHSALRKWAVLVLLILQTTSLVLMMRITRTREGPRYSPSSAVLIVEGIKVIMCIGLISMQEGIVGMVKLVKKQVFDDFGTTVKLAVPSGLYAIQNNLLYYALSNLDAATYQVLYQLKVLTTAIFSVLLLGKKLSCTQWVALFFLTAGCAIVQLQISTKKASTAKGPVQNPALGLVCILISCCTSGFAGVYFEKMLKSSQQVSIWMRNIQLGVWGTLFSIAIIYVNDYQTYLEHGLLYGYTGMVWCVIMNQALGGLIIAMVIKYADNIVKCFAVALSIILGAVLTAVFFDFEPTLQFVGGTVLVVGSVIMYSELPVMQEFITKLFASPKTKGYSSVQQTELEKV